MYNIFQLSSIASAYKQTWSKKGYVRYGYQKQYDVLEDHFFSKYVYCLDTK